MTELLRCAWAGEDPAYVAYHDTEWGVPIHDARHLFELLCLEGAQAGLAWITILRKRDGYRLAFDGFDPQRVAGYTEDDVERLMADSGIVRNRAKINAAIGNARAWLDLDDPVRWLWDVTGGQPIQNRWLRLADIPAETEASRAMSRGLKDRGFRFVGPTICYAFMQSAGMVNDHVVGCFRHAELARAGASGMSSAGSVGNRSVPGSQ